MTNYKIGIQLTKNEPKYEHLLNMLNSNLDVKKRLEFIHISDDLDLKNKIRELDILTTYSMSENIFLHASNKLKWIHFGAAGVEQSLFPSILKSKTIITNASGIHSEPVSEFTIGMILYLSKQFRGCENFKNNAKWTQWKLAQKTIQLNGKTVGIIGFGKIGKSIAKKAKAFNMNVIATRRLQKKVENKKIVDELIPVSELDYLLRKSDYLVIACPLTPLTNGMIGNKELGKMKSTAFIINIARGPIIDEKSLIEVLKSQKIMGAGLDVFSTEPLDKDSPLFRLDNVFLSPHISGNFPEYQEDVILQFTDNLNRYLTGKNLKNRVCKKRLY